MDFNAAVKSVDTQLLARITKVALFTLMSIAATAMFVLSEAAVIAWPLTLPVIATTIILGGLFFRLNSLDKTYVSWMSDDMRASLVKNELERIFHSKDLMSSQDLTKSLKAVNRVLGNSVFNEEKIQSILTINAYAQRTGNGLSLAETAQNQKVPIEFSCSSEWTEEARFGLSPFDYAFTVTWDPTPGQIGVTYSCTERLPPQQQTAPTSPPIIIATPVTV